MYPLFKETSSRHTRNHERRHGDVSMQMKEIRWHTGENNKEVTAHPVQREANLDKARHVSIPKSEKTATTEGRR